MKKEKEIRDLLNVNYGINVSPKWVQRYAWKFGYLIQSEQILKLEESIEYILDNIEKFAYFIHGHRAYYVEKKHFNKD